MTARRLAATVAGAVAVVSVVRLAVAQELTASATWAAALRGAVPIGLAGLAGLWSERSGVVNIGLEGMMVAGTWCAAWGSWQHGPWWGVAFGVAGGAAAGLLHAAAVVGFDVDHIVSGVAVNLLAAGVARFASSIAFTGTAAGGVTQSPIVRRIGEASLPVLAGGAIGGIRTPDLLGGIEARRWLVASDVAGVARGFLSGVSWLTVAAACLAAATAWIHARTRTGLRLRSVGESPATADSLGLHVARLRVLGVAVSGGLAGLAGAFLVLASSGLYREGQTGGRGFVGLAVMIFGNWTPSGVAAGALLFGFADALQLRSGSAVHALLLVAGLGLGALSVARAARRRRREALVAAIAGAALVAVFASTSTIPSQFVFFTPHVATLLVLGLSRQRLRPPAAAGLPYRSGRR